MRFDSHLLPPELEQKVQETARQIAETGICLVCDCEVVPVPPLTLLGAARPHAKMCVLLEAGGIRGGMGG